MRIKFHHTKSSHQAHLFDHRHYNVAFHLRVGDTSLFAGDADFFNNVVELVSGRRRWRICQAAGRKLHCIKTHVHVSIYHNSQNTATGPFRGSTDEVLLSSGGPWVWSRASQRIYLLERHSTERYICQWLERLRYPPAFCTSRYGCKPRQFFFPLDALDICKASDRFATSKRRSSYRFLWHFWEHKTWSKWPTFGAKSWRSQSHGDWPLHISPST